MLLGMLKFGVVFLAGNKFSFIYYDFTKSTANENLKRHFLRVVEIIASYFDLFQL